MATTINNIKVDFGLGAAPPRVTFLQGADMNITNIRDTLRQIEESEEGRMAPGATSKAGEGKGWIARAGGNFEFSETESSALTLEIMAPFDIFFESGAIPFQTSVGSLIGTFADSPGAIVQINNAIGASNLNTEQINVQAFLNATVYIDTLDGNPGTAFSLGTPADPSDNYPDAKAIANSRGFSKFHLRDTLTLTSSHVTAETEWEGNGPTNSEIILASGADTTGVFFKDMTVSGIFSGATDLEGCWVDTSTGFSGTLKNCSLLGDITLASAGTTTLVINDCQSQVAGSGRPKVDINGANIDVNIRSYVGGLTLAGQSQVKNTSIDINPGTIEIDSTCTAGFVRVRGHGELIDNSGPSCIVDSTGFLQIDGDIAGQFVEGSITIEGALRAILAANAAKLTGADTTSIAIRDTGDTKDRILATVDSFGNRTAVTLDLSD